jgi:lipid A 4'-phosphatase
MSAVVTASTGAARASRFPMGFLISALALGVVAGVIFLAFPQIDLMVSRAFYSGDRNFAGQSAFLVVGLRIVFIVVFWLCVAGAAAGLWMTRDRKRAWLHLSFPQWVFLAVCLAMGPGILANLLLKDHWGRARPRQVAEFGGSKTFTPPLIPANQCPRNCSFVSGEAASIYLPFYAVAFVVPQWSVVLVTAGTLLGLASGAVRVSQGAHFLSDVIFAGVFMALTAGLLYLAILGRTGTKFLAPQRTALDCGEEPRRTVTGP